MQFITGLVIIDQFTPRSKNDSYYLLTIGLLNDSCRSRTIFEKNYDFQICENNFRLPTSIFREPSFIFIGLIRSSFRYIIFQISFANDLGTDKWLNFLKIPPWTCNLFRKLFKCVIKKYEKYFASRNETISVTNSITFSCVQGGYYHYVYAGTYTPYITRSFEIFYSY